MKINIQLFGSGCPPLYGITDDIKAYAQEGLHECSKSNPDTQMIKFALANIIKLCERMGNEECSDT